MSNPSKAKGTRAETLVRRYLEAQGFKVERKALAGAADEGDLRVVRDDGTEVALEVKAGMQTAQYNRHQLDVWKAQTIVEGENAGTDCILVIVRYRRKLVDAECWLPPVTPDGLWRMCYLDDLWAVL